MDYLSTALTTSARFVTDNAHTLTTVGIGGCVFAVTSTFLPALGFGILGPTAGTLATYIQSTYYGATVASGSLFSFLQAAGMATGMQTTVAYTSGLAASVGYWVFGNGTANA